MRVALARHDIGAVFRIMQRYGLSQREIAALTGIAQSEVSAIISGRRRILAYTVLDRLVEGLQLPRGWAGLAFDDQTAALRQNTALGAPAGIEHICMVVRYANECRQARRRDT